MSEFSVIEEWKKQLPVNLSGLWQVIYYEGIHGHHILFSRSDLELFHNSPDLEEYPVERERLADLGYSLFHAGSFREMVEILETCHLSLRHQLFRLYKGWLGDMGEKIKARAN